MSRVLKVIQPLVAVAFLLLAGCMPAAPGSTAWSVQGLDGQVVTSAALAQSPCYVCALSTWDGSSQATLSELRRVVQNQQARESSAPLPALLLVFFDSPETEVRELATQHLPFVIASASREVADNWHLDTLPTLFYWNGQRLQVRQRGYLEEAQWHKLLSDQG